MYSKCPIEVNRLDHWYKTTQKFKRMHQFTNNQFVAQDTLDFKESMFKFIKPEIVESKPDHISRSTLFDNITIVKCGFIDNYAHCFLDILPFLLYSDKYFKSDLILSPQTDTMLSLINLIGLNFNKIKFLNEDESTTLKYKDKSKFVVTSQHRNYTALSLLKERIELYFSQNQSTTRSNRLIYCTRNIGSDVKHDRKMLTTNEQAIIKILKNYAEINNLVFTLFTGQENGKTMNHKKQMLMFREAKIVVGPHGGAMANIIYMNPKNKPFVCEFCCGIYSSQQIKHGPPFSQNYNKLYSFALEDIYNYSLIPFESVSTSKETIIDTINLQNYLSYIQEQKNMT